MPAVSGDFCLALDCSLKSITLALLKNNILIDAVSQLPTAQHSVTLLSSFHHLLQKNNLTLEQIGTVIYCRGPGGFTSLRVGLMTLRGLFWGHSVLVQPVSSLLFRCLSVQNKKNDRVVCVLRAGQDRFFVGVLEKRHAREVVFTESVVVKSDLQKLCDVAGQKTVAIGEGCVAILGQESPSLQIIPEDVYDPQAFVALQQSGLSVEMKDFNHIQIHYMQNPF